MKTTFKTFLLEATDSVASAYTKISEEQAIEIARTQCSEALSPPTPYILRGMDKKGDWREKSFFFIKGIKNRVSANTTNEYTVLVDNLPSWKEYPKRSQSLICATIGNQDYASNFGDVFIILPTNGAKIGVCNKHDFWNSFKTVNGLIVAAKFPEYGKDYGIPDLSDLNNILQGVIELSTKLSKTNTSFATLSKAFNITTNYLRDPKNDISASNKKFFNTVISGKETLLEFCERILDPQTNGIMLKDYQSIGSISKQKREVWLSAPSLAICGDEDLINDPKSFYTLFKNKVNSK